MRGNVQWGWLKQQSDSQLHSLQVAQKYWSWGPWGTWGYKGEEQWHWSSRRATAWWAYDWFKIQIQLRAEIFFCPSAILWGTEPLAVSAWTLALSCCFAECALHIFYYYWILSVKFVSGEVPAWLLTWRSDFHCFGELGVGPGARFQPDVLAWQWLCWPGHVYRNCIASSNCACMTYVFPWIMLICREYWITVAHTEGFSTLVPRTAKCWSFNGQKQLKLYKLKGLKRKGMTSERPTALQIRYLS